MRIRRLNEQGEEEDKEDEQEEMQSEELTRSCSEFLLSYSSEMVDCITSLSDDDEEKESFVASRLGQKLGKMLESYASHCSGKNKTLLFRHVPDDTPTKRWLIDKFKLPTRTLRVTLSPGVRRKRKNKSFAYQNTLSKWLPVLKKLSITENTKDERQEAVDPEERQVCELLSNVSLSHKQRKALWKWNGAKSLEWAVSVSFS
jgi:hypothetical protein